MATSIGQLVWAFVASPDQVASVLTAARAGRIAGVWLLGAEMPSPEATALLINRLQAESPRPLLIGVDAEAGLGHVMSGATELPNAMAIGASGDPRYAREAARVTAAEAAACGINVVAAPVLDVNINPDNPIVNTRSFGDDPQAVARMGIAYIEGIRAAEPAGRRVVPIAKHFPGHGDTSQDSHLQLGAVTASRERLEAVEFVPFRAAIDADVPLIMTAHVAYPALDPSGMPATLSQPILTGLLRQRLGYRGAVVTDALDMHAIAHNFSVGEAAIRAVVAGNDLLLTDQFDLVFEALLAATGSDALPAERVQDAAGRVHSVRTHLFGDQDTTPEPVDIAHLISSVGTADNKAVADEIAAASITLYDGHIAPPPARPLLLATHTSSLSLGVVEARLREALACERWEDVDLVMLDPTPDSAYVENVVERASHSGWAAVLHFNSVASYDPSAVGTSSELMALVAALARSGISTTVVSLGSPYALVRFPEAQARLCAYSTCPASVRAVLRVLQGTAPAPGHLPVQLAAQPV